VEGRQVQLCQPLRDEEVERLVDKQDFAHPRLAEQVTIQHLTPSDCRSHRHLESELAKANEDLGGIYSGTKHHEGDWRTPIFHCPEVLFPDGAASHHHLYFIDCQNCNWSHSTRSLEHSMWSQRDWHILFTHYYQFVKEMYGLFFALSPWRVNVRSHRFMQLLHSELHRTP
jgi:hypothetical protein